MTNGEQKESSFNFMHWIKDPEQTWGGFFLELLVLAGIVAIIRLFVFQPFLVSGPSMCPTLNVFDGKCSMPYEKSERVFVNEFLYNFVRSPERGDTVVFVSPADEKYLIKRIIGVPGDVIEIQNGRVYLTNDEHTDHLVDEPYLSAQNKNKTSSPEVSVFEVPEGSYFLMGDNRANSNDGRRCFSSCTIEGASSFVSEDRIVGKAEFVLWPINRIRWVKNELKDL